MFRMIGWPVLGVLLVVAGSSWGCLGGPKADPDAPSCTDGTQSGTETGVDCGGDCLACSAGEGCARPEDCASLSCVGNLCQGASCDDGILNGDEVNEDCGGSCDGCSDGESCGDDDDCASGRCDDGHCRSCADGARSGDESDIDCGFICGASGLCDLGDTCIDASDCESDRCDDGECASCADGNRTGDESDIDCGFICGASGLCDLGDTCLDASDCESDRCDDAECASCADGRMTGDEPATDCGAVCGPLLLCIVGSDCGIPADCVEGVCTSGTCVAGTCSDQVINQDETGEDCGGGCPPCAAGGGCEDGDDCVSEVCGPDDLCRAPACDDGVLNGTESALDCGGDSCPPCYSYESVTLTAPVPSADDNFGYSIGADGDYLVVGAPELDPVIITAPLANAGGAFVFKRGGPDDWSLVAELVAPDAEAGDQFGSAVGISGTTIVIGAVYEDGGGNGAGAVYVFMSTGTDVWDAGVKLMASDAAAGDHFGFSVDVSGDFVIVGSPDKTYNPGGVLQAGAAYVFHREGAGNVWDAGVGLPFASGDVPAAMDHFGYSVATSGSHAVVGEPHEASDTGAAFYYIRTGTTAWDAGTRVSDGSVDPGDQFGTAVALSGSQALVGYPLNSHDFDGPGGEPEVPSLGAAITYSRFRIGEKWANTTGGRRPPQSDAYGYGHFAASVDHRADISVAAASAASPQSELRAGVLYVISRPVDEYVYTVVMRDPPVAEERLGDGFPGVALGNGFVAASRFRDSGGAGAVTIFR